jgi:hypothetical protein
VKAALLAVLLLGPLAAEEVVWDHLPWAVYTEEGLYLALRLPQCWTLHGPSGPVDLDPLHAVHLDARELEHVRLRSADGRPQGGIRVLRPGDGGVLELQAGRLASDGEVVVLALSRLEHIEDRRWMVLRPSRSEPLPCKTRIEAPSVPLGESGVLAQIAVSRTRPVWKEGVLVELPASDRHVGWNHRAYRQTLAWFVADLWRRGATRIVLVQPPVPAAELDAIRALWAQVRDVARTYRCDLIEVEALGETQYWQLGPGLLGDSLNSAGRAALDERCAAALVSD